MLLASLSSTAQWTRNCSFIHNRKRKYRSSRNITRSALSVPASTTQSIQISPEELKEFLKGKEKTISKKRIDSLVTDLGTNLQSGLITDKQSFASRRDVFGSNVLKPLPPVSFQEVLKDALDDFTLQILIISGAISLVLETALSPGADYAWLEGAAILSSVAVVVTVSAYTNYQKEVKFRELSAINEDSPVRVIRDGMEQEMSCFELLTGDIVKIEGGDILQSDGILIDGSQIQLDESHLTGESDSVTRCHTLDPLVYSGSKVNEGVGRMLVLAVGANSTQGSIASLASGKSPDSENTLFRQKTVLTEKLEKLAGDIGRFGLAAALITLVSMASQFTYHIFVQDPQPWDWQFLEIYLHQLIVSITILVVAVPEGLPLASTLALAFSIQRMMQDNNLVRHLEACETMGSITTICTDKTGTLTLNDLNVQQLWIDGNVYSVHQRKLPLEPVLCQLIAESISLNTTASLKIRSVNDIECIGNRTECGLLKFVNKDLKLDYERIRQSWNYLKVIPFTSSSKKMAVVVQNGNKKLLHVKGAPEIVLQSCKFKLSPSGERSELDDKD